MRGSSMRGSRWWASMGALACLLVSGCSAPAPDDPEVRQQADRAHPQVRALADRARGQGRLVWGGDGDSCAPGRNDWKTKSGYEWKCTVNRIEAVSLPGDPAEAFPAADREFAAAGCTSHDDPSRADLATMAQSYRATAKNLHDLPAVELRCGEIRADLEPTDASDPAMERSGDGIWSMRRDYGESKDVTFERQKPDSGQHAQIRRAAAEPGRTTLLLYYSLDYHTK